MERFEVSGKKDIEKVIKAENRQEAAKIFIKKHKIIPEFVGDSFVEGICERCGNVIFESEKYGWGDGIRICENCDPECKEWEGSRELYDDDGAM